MIGSQNFISVYLHFDVVIKISNKNRNRSHFYNHSPFILTVTRKCSDTPTLAGNGLFIEYITLCCKLCWKKISWFMLVLSFAIYLIVFIITHQTNDIKDFFYCEWNCVCPQLGALILIGWSVNIWNRISGNDSKPYNFN